MELRKIAIASFIGGALCTVIALMVTPAFWWLGLIAGFVAGYFGYEMRETLRAIPMATRSAANMVTDIKSDVADWFSKPHPFVYYGLIFSIPVIFVYIFALTRSPNYKPSDTISMICFFVLCSTFFMSIAPLCTYIVARLGAESEHKYIEHPIVERKRPPEEIEWLTKQGLRSEPSTYRNVLRWFLKGLLIIVSFFIWMIPKQLLLFIWKVIAGSGHFLLELTKSIFSHKRILCAFSGAIGGGLSYLLLAQGAETLQEKILLALFGGLISAGVGALSWELVSKRLLNHTHETS